MLLLVAKGLWPCYDMENGGDDMKLGFCTDINGLALARRADCDYIEMGFAAVCGMPQESFDTLCLEVDRSSLRVEAMNGFIPGEFRLCEMNDWDPVLDFVRKGMSRAALLGCQVVVFGSGAARRVPEGMDKEEALSRLCDFAYRAGDIAEEHDITIAIEPLCYAECNILNTVIEGYDFSLQVGHPRVRVLADLYHMGQNGEDMSGITAAGKKLAHCHIGRPGPRKYPLPQDGYDYTPFFAALKQIGYAGRLSVEAGFVHGPEDIVMSISYLKDLAR
jgi:sugar phosphate isomerase/epimerase